MSRPDCFDFVLEFVGDPEASVLERYVSDLEAEVERLKAAIIDLANNSDLTYFIDYGDGQPENIALVRSLLDGSIADKGE